MEKSKGTNEMKDKKILGLWQRETFQGFYIILLITGKEFVG